MAVVHTAFYTYTDGGKFSASRKFAKNPYRISQIEIGPPPREYVLFVVRPVPAPTAHTTVALTSRVAVQQMCVADADRVVAA